MKKNIIKLLSATIMAASIAVPTTSAIFAEYTPDKVVNADEQSTKIISQKNSIIIDNNILEDIKTINSKTTTSEDILLFPARNVFEALGYTVEWQNETRTVIVSDIPQYITFSIGKDGYTIAKTAPMMLNKEPELINGITYVPVSLLSEIMEMDVEIDEDYNLIINTTSEETEETSNGLSNSEETEETSDELSNSEETEETSDELSNSEETEESTELIKTDVLEANAEVISVDEESIVINDLEKGEIVLAIGEDTEIIFYDNTKATKKDIKENAKLYVEYGEIMTSSLPPINNPKKIVIFK